MSQKKEQGIMAWGGKVEEGGRGGCIVGSRLPNSEGLHSGSLGARGRAGCGAVGDVVPPPHMGYHPASGAKRQGDSYRQAEGSGARE